MMPQLQPVSAPVLMEKAKRGRPKKADTLVVNVRLSVKAYEAYIKAGYRLDEDVRTIMRKVLTFHAPKG